jgi:hypothetical protein
MMNAGDDYRTDLSSTASLGIVITEVGLSDGSV